MRFAFIDAEKAKHRVSTMCRVLKVSRSGLYAWTKRTPSVQCREDDRLTVRIRASHAASNGCYGSPRVHQDLLDDGCTASRKRVARIMRECGIRGCPPKRFKRTTESDHRLPIARNVLARSFTATRPNEAWVTDITYVRTWEGWLYVAVIIDLFSRRVVGWAIADHLRTELVLDALRMALGRRTPSRGLVHHSDRGCQYASKAYREILARRGITCSMSRRGDCWDNAVAESFFATIKKELIYRSSWPTRAIAKHAMIEYLEIFYNRHRRHSSIGYLSPAEFEDTHQPVAKAA